MIRRLGVAAICLALAGVFVAAKPASKVKLELDAARVWAAREGSEVVLLVAPERGDGFITIARRWAESGDEAVAGLKAANPEIRAPQSGRPIRIPLRLLEPAHRKAVLDALFPNDRTTAEGRRHIVGEEARLKDAAGAIANWFTGHSSRRDGLRQGDGSRLGKLRKGSSVLIPNEFLDPALRLPEKPRPTPTASAPPPAVPIVGGEVLEWDADVQGAYAIYRLRPGEALYSSVVVRFTGRVFAADVNELASVIACRSDIPDVTDIPIGFPVKIPLELLATEYLPSWDPRRQDADRAAKESAKFKSQVRAKLLDGIHIVLDPGHGGRDVGTSHGGIWESTYVYDIYCRVKIILERDTEAKVWLTVRDRRQGFGVGDDDRLPTSKSAELLTEPPLDLDDPVAGVHLRWYLANSRFGRLRKAGVSSDKVVFISIHADSLHPSLRGAMAYVPGERFLGGRFGKTGPVYENRKEWKEGPVVEFSSVERFQSEGYSRDLAEHLLTAFARNGLALHPYHPIRQNVIRNKREWVPAVLRYNRIPARVLLEVANLGNPDDRELVQTRAWRERAARAIVDALLAYYDGERAAAATGLQ